MDECGACLGFRSIDVTLSPSADTVIEPCHSSNPASERRNRYLVGCTLNVTGVRPQFMSSMKTFALGGVDLIDTAYSRLSGDTLC